MLNKQYYQSLGLESIYDKVLTGTRLSFKDGLALFRCQDLTAVGALALHKRLQLHEEKTYYVVNRQINYTNICVNGCTFCAFRRDKGTDSGAFLLSKDDIIKRIEDARKSSLHLDELHIVGGCHPKLPLAWFEDLLATIKEIAPDLPIKAFTPVEINHFAQLEKISTLETLKRLQAAGLMMMPGGGAEIFAEDLRQKLCPHKADAKTWLRISSEAHSLGIKTNCTMLFGHVESFEDRVDHLLRLRTQQDESHGFTCFIALPYLQKNNRLVLPQERIGPVNGLDHLRTIAVARLLLDNIPHIKAYWVMLGVQMAQTALWYGANDLDGTIVEEHIGHMAGAKSAQGLTIEQLENMIKQSGFTPIRRNAVFSTIDKPNHAGQKEAEPTEDLTPSQTSQSAAANDARNYALVAKTLQAMPMASDPFHEDDQVAAIAQEVLTQKRIDLPQAATIYAQASLQTLAHLAHTIRLAKHPEPIVTYVGDRNINYSNICVCGCRFCAFFRPPNNPEGYVITREQMTQKIDETLALGGTQILLQGGHNPNLPLEWYEDLLSWMHKKWPTLHIHAFSPPEIFYWSKLFNLPVAEIIARLKAAGLNSIPGGGAEVLNNEVRKQVSPNKCTADEWLAVMREAHLQGMRTTATMMFGHEEEPIHRLEHLFRLRDLQDETHGFTAFIPWTFQPEHTRISCQSLPAPAYLRLLAVARIVLDNFDNLQASWVTMGPEVAQLALFYGANDYGSLMIEENVVAAAGVSYHLTRQEIENVIKAAGFTPIQRTMYYTPVDKQSSN